MGVRPAKRNAARTSRAAIPASGEKLINYFPGLAAPVAASSGEFFESISLETSEYLENVYKPQNYKTAKSRNQAGEALGPGLNSDLYYIDSEGNFVDRSVYRQSYDEDIDTGELIVPGMQGPQEGESEAPAPISVVPTSTTNPERPRTVAAGYDRARGVITVVFRDGTFYNYYEVTPAEWQDFKRRVSKGRYIYRYLDFKPRGPAKASSIPASARKALYGYSRSMQVNNTGKQTAAKKGKNS